jgi:spore germination cell wall hydrolase CwlJ-like protein
LALAAKTANYYDFEPLVLDRKQIECLADTVYHEARGEPKSGKLAVAYVVLNRSYLQGRTLCQIITAPHQFPWARRHKSFKHYDQEASQAAFQAVTQPYTFQATHFHNTLVNPRWELTKVEKIGNHVFYK